MLKVVIFTSFITLILSQSCAMADSSRIACGDQNTSQDMCQNKKCCWNMTSFPWCFYPKGQSPCEFITYDYSGGQNFEPDFVAKMKEKFMANINIQGKGGVVAAPDKNTPGGSYYYHWMRDAGLTMRAYQDLNDNNFSVIESTMKSYVNFVLNTQQENNPYPSDIRVNPKFELPNGEVFVGGWCRPQTDGPGLTSAALIQFANNLIDNGQTSYVKEYLWTQNAHHGGAIKYDLEWIISNWQLNGCDLWQEIQSDDFFWNRMAFVHALTLGQKFASRMGDSTLSNKYTSTKSLILNSLNSHWNGQFLTQSINRQQDGSVIHALSSFPEKYGFTDAKVASTIKTLAKTFCFQYKINQGQTQRKIPGVLIGRYPGDVYAQGNPWQLLTAVLAELFYKGASSMIQPGFQLGLQARNAWSDLLKIDSNSSIKQFAKALTKAGDSVMFRLWLHVQDDGGRIDEQIGKVNGLQVSAKSLTWSYANILSAIKARNKNISELVDNKILSQE